MVLGIATSRLHVFRPWSRFGNAAAAALTKVRVMHSGLVFLLLNAFGGPDGRVQSVRSPAP